MYSKLQVAICDPKNTTGSSALCLPSIEQITLSDLSTLKNHVANYSKSHTFIVLVLDLNDQNSSPILDDIRKEANVFAIFIRVKSRCNFTLNGGNVYPVAKQFMTHKIISSVIRFYEITSTELLKSNHIFHADYLKKRANAMKDQRRLINTTIEACHVLIIQMNTKEDHLWECQEELINICNDLCGDYEPTVFILDNYFASDENSDLYGNDEIDIKCNFIKRIARIRMYLFGNEIHNLHSLSQSLFENELNGSNEDEYDEKYTAIEYEPVTDQTKQYLANSPGYSSTWQLPNIILKRLDGISTDIKFPAALERVNINLKARAMVADIELSQQAMNNSANSIECSGAFHLIEQAQNGPSEQSEGANGEMENMIQYDLPASIPN